MSYDMSLFIFNLTFNLTFNLLILIIDIIHLTKILFLFLQKKLAKKKIELYLIIERTVRIQQLCSNIIIN